MLELSKELEMMLNKYDNLVEETALGMLEIIKSDSKSYGEVRERIYKFERLITYEHQDKHYFLIKKIREVFKKEMNNLPLTNRSSQ